MKSTKIRIFIDFVVFVGRASGNIKIDKNTYFCRFQRSPFQKRNCSYKNFDFQTPSRALYEMATFGRRPGQHPQTPPLPSGCRIRLGGRDTWCLCLGCYTRTAVLPRPVHVLRRCVEEFSRYVRSACIPHAYHVQTTCRPRAYHVHTTCISRAYRIHTTCTPRAYHMHTTWKARVYHV